MMVVDALIISEYLLTLFFQAVLGGNKKINPEQKASSCKREACGSLQEAEEPAKRAHM